MIRDYSYAVFQFLQHKQLLIADNVPTIDDAERIASVRARETRRVHIVVNRVTQTIVSRFEGVEHRPSSHSHQDEPMALSEALDASRQAERQAQEQERNDKLERRRQGRAKERRLCPAHWENLEAAVCDPGYKYCSFQYARKSGIPNSSFADKKLARYVIVDKSNLGAKKENETRNEQSNGTGAGSGAPSSPEEGLQSTNPGPENPRGQDSND